MYMFFSIIIIIFLNHGQLFPIAALLIGGITLYLIFREFTNPIKIDCDFSSSDDIGGCGLSIREQTFLLLLTSGIGIYARDMLVGLLLSFHLFILFTIIRLFLSSVKGLFSLPFDKSKSFIEKLIWGIFFMAVSFLFAYSFFLFGRASY